MRNHNGQYLVRHVLFGYRRILNLNVVPNKFQRRDQLYFMLLWNLNQPGQGREMFVSCDTRVSVRAFQMSFICVNLSV